MLDLKNLHMSMLYLKVYWTCHKTIAAKGFEPLTRGL